MQKLITAIFAVALLLTSSVGIATAAPKSDVGAIHLDLSGGFASENGSFKQFEGIYNYGGTFSVKLDKKVTGFVYIGGNTATQITTTKFVLPTTSYTTLVYDAGLNFRLSPATSVKFGYGQFLDPASVNGTPNLLHSVSVEARTRVF